MLNLEAFGVNGSESEKISQIKQRCQLICDYMINEKGTIRMCEAETSIPHSTIHHYIHSYIKLYYNEEYQRILPMLRYNKRYRRKPKKYWD